MINQSGTPGTTDDDGFSMRTRYELLGTNVRDSRNPNRYNLTNIPVVEGTQLTFRVEKYPSEGFGMTVWDVVVTSGEDALPTTMWDLNHNFSTHGAEAIGIGPDAAWSYGNTEGGSGFNAFDQIKPGFEVTLG